MSRTLNFRRLARIVLVGIASLIAVVVIVALIAVRTEWFRNYVKRRIVSAAEQATGGRVEVGSFSFDEWHLRATVVNVVIHGKEPAASAPFLRVEKVVADLRLFPKIDSPFGISFLGVDRPEANIIILGDGTSNIPSPRTSASTQPPLRSVVDLEVGKFDLTSGLFAVQAQKTPIDVRGNNLRVLLFYNQLSESYRGDVSLEPLYVVSGRNTPVTLKVNLPVTIAADRIDLKNAAISTPASVLYVNGSIANLRTPRITANISGTIATSDLKNGAALPLDIGARGVPDKIELAADVTVANDSVSIGKFRTTIGKSSLEMNGSTLQSSLDLGELGRLLDVSARPEGIVSISGNAALNSGSYSVNASLHAHDIAFQSGTARIRNVGVSTDIRAIPRLIELSALRITALGGEVIGSASLQDFQRYEVNGDLRKFDLSTSLKALGTKLPYDGIVSGLIAAKGDIDRTTSLVARSSLVISPGRNGVPLSGRINAEYSGAADNLVIEKSYMVLPHSRLDVNGAIAKTLNISLTSRDLNDFLAAANISGEPVSLNHGRAVFTGTVTGGVRSPRIAGQLAATLLVIEGRQFDSLAAELTASKTGAAIRNGVISRGAMCTSLAGSVGLSDWKFLPREPVAADVSITDGDIADVMAMAGQSGDGYSGALTANAHVNGTAGNPLGTVGIQVVKGEIHGQPFDQARLQANLTDRLITISSSSIQSGPARVDLTGDFRHPPDSMAIGHLHAKLNSNQVELAKIASLPAQGTAGTAYLNLELAGDLTQTKAGETEVLVAAVNGDVSAHGVRIDNQPYGDFQAAARTSGHAVTYNLTSNFAGSSVRVNGTTQLVRDYPTTADGAITNLPIDKVLSVARRTDIPAKGNLSGSAHLDGTITDPHGDANIELTRASIFDEPLDQVHIRAAYLARSIDISQFEVSAGAARIDLTAHYDHPANDLRSGNATFNLNSNAIDLARIHNIQTLRSGLGGTLQINARGNGAISQGKTPVTIHDLNLNVAATGLKAQGQNFGDLKLVANSGAGNKLAFTLDSNLASASIQGRGSAELTAGYPVDAQISFTNLLYSRISTLIGGATVQPGVEAAVDGACTVTGPVLNTDQLRAGLRLTRVNITAKPTPGQNTPVVITNQGPISATLDRGRVQIQSAHLSGTHVDIQATGGASLPAKTLAINLNAKVGLSILPVVDPDIYSSGDITVEATIHGSVSQPLVNGQMTLQSATLNYAGILNGISNANGVVAFTGNTATIRSLTAESGGGKINLSGYASYSDVTRYGIRMTASRVRFRLQEGISIIAGADVQLTGTSRQSVVSGSAVIDQVTYNPRTDIGSLLSRSGPSVETFSAPSPILENTRLDVRVRTSSGLAVQADIAQNISATADIRLQGTLARPAALGRISINEGKLVFFGSSYTVDSGTIAFYNPLEIDPVLDISLETQTQGVEVTVRVTGPVDNMKLSYTSNPPLQFQEIISLLAAGKTPTTDPTLLANQPQTPQASLQQMGESAALGEAVANPLAGRLQRVFGVSQLKIDPAFQGGSALPTARLTLQQRITSNITFTYTSALDDPNGQIVKVEWAFDPKWSAVATRDQNGIFSVNFFYKKQFR